MCIHSPLFNITMELYETDRYQLQKFISITNLLCTNEDDKEFTQDYFILYDFAQDCRYSKCIQPELIWYLLSFYYKIIEQAIIYKYHMRNYLCTENNEKISKMVIDIYFEFNLALFFNQKI